MRKKIKESDADWKAWKETIKNQEGVEKKINRKTAINRNELNLQHFFNDMQEIGNQVRSGATKKPNFHYGDLSVTNYLLCYLIELINKMVPGRLDND